MKSSGAVLSLKRMTIKDKGLLAAFISSLTGIISGTLIYTFFLINENPIFDVFHSFYTDFKDKTDIEAFSGIVVVILLYFFVLFISGSSFMGKYLCVSATFFKAVGIGALISFLYSEYGLKGLEYVLLVFFPGKCILLFAAILMTKNSFDMSNTVKNGMSEKGSIASFVKMYYVKSLLSLIIFIVSATADFLLIKIFSDLFDFFV